MKIPFSSNFCNSHYSKMQCFNYFVLFYICYFHTHSTIKSTVIYSLYNLNNIFFTIQQWEFVGIFFFSVFMKIMSNEMVLVLKCFISYVFISLFFCTFWSIASETSYGNDKKNKQKRQSLNSRNALKIAWGGFWLAKTS